MSTRTHTPILHPREDAAFSLIEVLIAITVLAVGLVGLAAVFPSVIRQQRDASDAVLGVSAARTAAASLIGHTDLDQARVTTIISNEGPTANDPRRNPSTSISVEELAFDPRARLGWQMLTCRVLEDSRVSRPFSWLGQWETPAITEASTNGGIINESGPGLWLDRRDGGLYVGNARGELAGLGGFGQEPDPFRLPTRSDPSLPTDYRVRSSIPFGTTVQFPVQARLLPQAPGVSPRFVWDIAVRRIDAGQPNDTRGPIRDTDPDALVRAASFFDDKVQIAIFIRPIDNPTSSVRRRQVAFLPVSADQNARPTFSGGAGATARDVPLYSPLVFASFTPNPANPSQITLDQLQFGEVDALSNADTAPRQTFDANQTREYLQVLGQKFVDAMGVVHRVVGVGPPADGAQGANRLTLTIDPPISEDLIVRAGIEAASSSSVPLQPFRGPVGAAALVAIFSPQGAAAIEVITIDPGAKQ